MFDIVIPLGPNEQSRFPLQLQYLISNVIGFQRIYVIAKDDPSSYWSNLASSFPHLNIHSMFVWINEKEFPFSIDDLLGFYPKIHRVAWYFQQLIKLYACHVIPGLSEYYLVVDADVFFLKPLSFFTITETGKMGKPIYSTGTEYFVPYFKHMQKLHPHLVKMITDKSGICHHMMFRRSWLFSLFSLVELFHCNQPFWKLFIQFVDEHHFHEQYYPDSGASEYEIFFNFVCAFHKDEIVIRNLKWENISCNLPCLNDLISSNPDDYDFISVCHHL